MQFGKKASELVENKDYLRVFKKGDTNVRFLDDPEDWIFFREHFTSGKQSFPCTGDTQCPGCNSTDEETRKATRKYATMVYLVDQKQTLPFKLPFSLVQSLLIRQERNQGTLTNRDYVIIRTGDGLSTSYEVDPGEKYDMDVSRLRGQATVDVEDCLKNSYVSVWGSIPGTEKSVPIKATAEKTNNGFDAADFNPAPQDGALELSESEIRAMSKVQLRELATKFDVFWDDEDTSQDIANRLITQFS